MDPEHETKQIDLERLREQMAKLPHDPSGAPSDQEERNKLWEQIFQCIKERGEIFGV